MSIRMRWDEILARIPEDRPYVGAEIGVWVGELSDHLLTARPLLELHLVDLWTTHSQGSRLSGICSPQDAKRRTEAMAARHGGRAVIHHGASTKVLHQFAPGSLDFAFIDAKHTYAAVKADTAWRDKVKPGGWIGGHDWADRFPGVARAAIEAFGRGQIELGDDYCWFVNL